SKSIIKATKTLFSNKFFEGNSFSYTKLIEENLQLQQDLCMNVKWLLEKDTLNVK
ncbi:14752_t:CDS:1, partial [Entrophospora sp. SA101]